MDDREKSRNLYQRLSVHPETLVLLGKQWLLLSISAVRLDGTPLKPKMRYPSTETGRVGSRYQIASWTRSLPRQVSPCSRQNGLGGHCEGSPSCPDWEKCDSLKKPESPMLSIISLPVHEHVPMLVLLLPGQSWLRALINPSLSSQRV